MRRPRRFSSPAAKRILVRVVQRDRRSRNQREGQCCPSGVQRPESCVERMAALHGAAHAHNDAEAVEEEEQVHDSGAKQGRVFLDA